MDVAVRELLQKVYREKYLPEDQEAAILNCCVELYQQAPEEELEPPIVSDRRFGQPLRPGPQKKPPKTSIPTLLRDLVARLVDPSLSAAERCQVEITLAAIMGDFVQPTRERL